MGYMFDIVRLMHSDLRYVSLSLQLMLFKAGAIEQNPRPKRSQLTLGHINARSLAIEDKFDEISSYILNERFELFAVSETWLDKRIHSETLHISGYYSLIRKDRLYSRGGGVALYIGQTLPIPAIHYRSLGRIQFLMEPRWQ
jgi:hypothetical protein